MVVYAQRCDDRKQTLEQACLLLVAVVQTDVLTTNMTRRSGPGDVLEPRCPVVSGAAAAAESGLQNSGPDSWFGQVSCL